MPAKLNARHFVHVCGSTCSDDGLWMRRSSLETVDVIELSYWDDLDSSATATYGTYNVQSGTVDLTSDALGQAFRCCGYYLASDGAIVSDAGDVLAEANSPAFLIVAAECLWRYGAKDLACDVSGNNRRALFRTARNAL